MCDLVVLGQDTLLEWLSYGIFSEPTQAVICLIRLVGDVLFFKKAAKLGLLSFESRDFYFLNLCIL